jgi:hypothetical protein
MQDPCHEGTVNVLFASSSARIGTKNYDISEDQKHPSVKASFIDSTR